VRGLNVKRGVAADTEATGLIFHGPWRLVRYDFTPPKRGGRGAPKPTPVFENRKVCPARPFAFSFADMDGKTKYFRYKVDPMTREVLIKHDDNFKQMQDVLEDDRIIKYLHNPRYDITAYSHVGIEVRGVVRDTQILAHVATAGQELSYQLKPLAKKWVDYDDGDEKALKVVVNKLRQQAKIKHWAYATHDLAGSDPWKADMWMAPDSVVSPYAVGDVVRVVLLVHLWEDETLEDERMANLYEREHQLMWTLKDMEDAGTRVYPQDITRLRTFYEDYKTKQVKIAEANGGAGLNYGSTVQMSAVFYEQRGHPPVHTECWNKKKERYNYSLNGDQLVKMATGYQKEVRTTVRVWEKTRRKWVERTKVVWVPVPPDPLAKAVLEYKAAQQTISSFLDVYDRYAVQERWEDLVSYYQKIADTEGVEFSEEELKDLYGGPDAYGNVWILHPGYKQTGTITGRLSCSDPNLMQVASETTGRRKADIQSRPREAFGPRPGCIWYLPDYSQIEVWLFAFLSEEEKMQAILLSGRHFHTEIAFQVFGTKKDFKEHKEYYVKCAKLIMFAKLYGGGIAKIASLLKSSPEAAKSFIQQYEEELPGVPRFMRKMINTAMRDGVIYNPFGRRYTFEPHYAYTSVNYLIQGTAADVMKNALIRVHAVLKEKWPMVRLLLTIHDEIAIEAPKALHCRELMRDIVAAMQGDQEILNLPVPLPVEMKIVDINGRWNKTTKFSKKINDSIGAYTKAA
jgi:DNA polymerase I-like protein with 3'-5' exonuclease and polymerase domains